MLVTAEPRAGGETPAAEATVERLRAALPAVAGRGVSVDVGGVTASQLDLVDLIGGSMWKILLFLLGLSYLVLLVLLRSVVLPLKAVLMNLLSVGAAFGVLTVVFGEVDTLDPAARARGRLRALDGLRGVPALAHPRALRGDRRHAPRGRRGARGERADDHLGGG